MRKEVLCFIAALSLIVLGASVAYFRARSSDRGYCEQVRKQMEVVLKEIEEVRGLTPPTRVDVKVVTRSWIEENWAIPFVKSKKDEILYEEMIYKALFLLPPDANLTQIRIDQFKATMAAAVGDAVYVTREFFDPNNEVKALEILSHEVTHIIQRHHFNLKERSTLDGEQARSAIIEGDALITAEKFVLHHFGVQLRGLNGSYSPIEEIWLFPYKYGRSFVRHLLEIGGWDEVNRALKNPPNTTEQILHLNKYLSCEGFLEVNAPSLDGEGWKRAKSDRMGEHVILTILLTSISEEKAKEAAEGWNGDNLTLYLCDNGYLLEWVILWDSYEDALEFKESFQALLEDKGNRISPEIWYCANRYVFFHVSEEKTMILISSNLTAIENSISVVENIP